MAEHRLPWFSDELKVCLKADKEEAVERKKMKTWDKEMAHEREGDDG